MGRKKSTKKRAPKLEARRSRRGNAPAETRPADFEPAEATYPKEFGEHDRQDLAEDPGAALMRIVGDAVSSAQPIEVIERLLVVHERYEAGVARKEYAAAMAALRGELPRVFKTDVVDYRAKGGRVYYRHENLATMVEDLSPVMAAHGLSFRWRTDTTIPESIQVACIVTHAAGHSEEAVLSGPPDTSGSKNAIQAIASTVTYLQRYTLKACIGIAAGKDDDGAGGAPSERSAWGTEEERARWQSKTPPAGERPPIEQPRAIGQDSGAAKNGPGDGVDVDELHDVAAMFPGATGMMKVISTSQLGRLRNLAGKSGWAVDAVDVEVWRVLKISPSEIPSVGGSYEAIVRWFVTNSPAGVTS